MIQDDNSKVMMRDGDGREEEGGGGEEERGENEGTTQNWSSQKRKWLTCFKLLLVVLAYLFAGALIFRALERPDAVRTSENFDAALRRLASENDCVNESNVAELMMIVTRAIGEGGYDSKMPHASRLDGRKVNETLFSGMWSVRYSFFFATAVVTTVGFGYIAPRTGPGQLFCMFFAVIGIVITGSILLSVGEMLQALFLSKIASSLKTFTSRCSKAGPVLANIIFVYLLMIIPTSLIYFFTQSDWSYIDSHYFSVVAMTTIGFGDLQPSLFTGASTFQQYLHKILLITYLFVCLGAVSTMLDTFSKAERRGSILISSHLRQYKSNFSLPHRVQEAAGDIDIDPTLQESEGIGDQGRNRLTT